MPNTSRSAVCPPSSSRRQCTKVGYQPVRRLRRAIASPTVLTPSMVMLLACAAPFASAEPIWAVTSSSPSCAEASTPKARTMAVFWMSMRPKSLEANNSSKNAAANTKARCQNLLMPAPPLRARFFVLSISSPPAAGTLLYPAPPPLRRMRFLLFEYGKERRPSAMPFSPARCM